MKIFAIADLHLSIGVPQKKMDIFGSKWTGYMEKIAHNWKAVVSSQDLVLIPGDISWALKLEEALKDLEWIDTLPGTKVMIRGNHDYWWGSLSKLRDNLPASCHVIQNDAFTFNDISIAGARLWDSPEYHFGSYTPEIDEKIFNRELQRLELSLKRLDPRAKHRIAMTHYPPIGGDLRPSKASALLEKYGIEICVFGHLHGLEEDVKMFGKKNGVEYILTAVDHLDFTPLSLAI